MIDALTAIFALAAAGCWLWSSSVKFPKPGETVSLTDVGYNAQKQGRRSSWAATFAGAAAILQSVSIFVN